MNKKKNNKTKSPKPSRLIGPEDLRPGVYVTPAHETVEVLWCESPLPPGKEEVKPSRVTILPYEAGEAYKVLAVCHPFVLTKTRFREKRCFDLRQVRLARVSRAYGEAAHGKRKGKK